MSTQSSSSGVIGFGGLLTVVFITLKLTHYIDWSWWWMLSPIWIPLGVVLIVITIIGIVWLVITLFEGRQRRIRRRRRT